jgi:hypothetical protein
MVGEAAGGGPRDRQRPGVHDPVQVGLDLGLVGLADLVEDVADLVRPTALDGGVGEGRGQGRQQARAAVDAQHLEALAGQPAAHQIAQPLLPLGGALGGGETKVDDLLTGRPSTGSSAAATLRVDSPSTKHARIMRSTFWARLA